MKLSKFGYILSLLILSLIFFHKLILHPHQMYYSPYSDVLNIHLGNRILIAETFKEYGQLPLWDPIRFAGVPFLGNLHSTMFYPLNWLFLFLPIANLFGYLYIIHIFLAGVFMFALAKELKLGDFSSFISALVFMFAGKLISQIYAGHPEVVIGVIWIPLVFLFLERAFRQKSIIQAVFMGAILAIQFLGGHIQISFYTIFILSLFAIFRAIASQDIKVTIRFICLFIFGLLIATFFSAIQLLPSWELSNLSTRAGGMSYEFASAYSMPFKHLVNFLLPNAFGLPARGTYFGVLNYWAMCTYIGVLPLLLSLGALFFRRNQYTIFFAALALGSVLFALGRYTPLFGFFYRWVPGFAMFRVPTRMLYFFAFSIALLSGFGSQILIGNIETIKSKLANKILFILGILVAIGSLTFLISKNLVLTLAGREIARGYEANSWMQEESLEYWRQIIFSEVSNSLLIFSLFFVLGAGLLIWRLRKNLSLKYFKPLLVMLILVDLWLFAWPMIDIGSPKEIFASNPVIKFLKKDSSLFRLWTFPHHLAAKYHLEIATGYEPTELNRYMEFLEYCPETTKLALLNVKYLISEEPREDFDLVYKGNDYSYYGWGGIQTWPEVYIYRNRNCLPRAFVVGQAEIMDGEDQILERLRSFDPRKSVLLEKPINPVRKFEIAPLELEILTKGAAGSFSKRVNKVGNSIKFQEAEVKFYSPNRVVIEGDLNQPGFLVLSEVWYPGWQAYSNGQLLEIYRANYTFRSIYLDSGENRIEFIYQPFSYKIGRWVSGFSWLCLMGILVLKKRKGEKELGK